MTDRKNVQLAVFAGLLLLYALLAFTYILFTPADQLMPVQNMPELELPAPKWILGLANAGIGLIVYGLLGLAGRWLAARAQLPGVFRADAGWKGLFAAPALYGLTVGIVVALLDGVFGASAHQIEPVHPPFPFSVVAAGTAAIGEELLYRLFLLSLWALVLRLIVRRLGGTVNLSWLANAFAAVAFAVAHLPAAMLILGVSTPAQLPATLLAEIIVLNTLVGLVAGQQYIRSGLVAAIGVHFWMDIVLHVVWPLVTSL